MKMNLDVTYNDGATVAAKVAAVDFVRFEEAFKLAENHAKYKLPEVHLKYALHLEDENRFKEAEEEFIKANKP